MKALKAQMNPHFIYNGLNSIQSLVANDKKREGIYYIGSFSRLLSSCLTTVENSLWHGLSRKDGGKKITITVNAGNGWLICDIMDNGIGRAKAKELKRTSVAMHQPKAVGITNKRLIDFNEDNSVNPIEFADLYDDKNNPPVQRLR